MVVHKTNDCSLNVCSSPQRQFRATCGEPGENPCEGEDLAWSGS